MMEEGQRYCVLMPVLLDEQWHVDLAIASVACHSDRFGKDPKDLVIIIADSKRSKFRIPPESLVGVRAEVQILACGGGRLTEDLNMAIQAAPKSAEFLVHSALDIFPGDGWGAAFDRIFKSASDAGIVTTSFLECGSPPIGRREPVQGEFVEGMYGPFMAFRRYIENRASENREFWSAHFDSDNFTAMASDSDLVMEFYSRGWRSYRTNEVVSWHLNGAVMRGRPKAERDQNAQMAASSFQRKWGRSPLWMAKVIQNGAVVYGREENPHQ